MSGKDDLLTYSEGDITVAGSSTSLNFTDVISTPPPKLIEIFIEGAQIRYRTDGTAPTASVGEVLNPFDRLTLVHPSDMWQFRAIRTGGTSATLHFRFKR